jgi:hypothetical protein
LGLAHETADSLLPNWHDTSRQPLDRYGSCSCAPGASRAMPTPTVRGRTWHPGSRRQRARLVLPCPGPGAIQFADANILQHGRLKVCCVHRDRIARTLFSVLVVCDATTPFTTEVRTHLTSPGVLRKGAGRSVNSDQRRFVIGPQCSIASCSSSPSGALEGRGSEQRRNDKLR